jgi:hypothetical protein
MGVYIQSGEEIVDEFEKWLLAVTFEGDVNADSIAEAWNILSKKHHWESKLVPHYIVEGGDVDGK